MKLPHLSFQFLNRLFIAVFCYLWLSSSIRYVLVGTHEMSGVFQSVVTVLPDLLVTVLFLACLIKFRELYASGEFQFSGFDKLFLIFVLTNVILGFVLAMNPKLSALSFRITYFPMFFYFFGRLYAGQEKKLRDQLLMGLFGTILVFTVVGFLIYFLFPHIDEKIATEAGLDEARYFIPRMSSVLWRSPILFGTLAGMGSLYYYYRLCQNPRPLYFLWFAILVGGVLMSVSRGPMIGVLCGFLLISLLFHKIKPLVFTVLICLATAVVVSIYSSGGLFQLRWIMHSTYETFAFKSDVTRVGRWTETFADFRARPWGYGLGKAGAVAYRYLSHRNIPGAPLSTDGWYLKQACETGLYGLLSFLVMMGAFFIRSIRSLFGGNRGMIVLSMALMIMMNAQALVSNVFDFYPFIMIVWVLMAFGENENEEAALAPLIIYE